MARLPRLLAPVVLLSMWTSGGARSSSPLFALRVPSGMVTGPVDLGAEVADGRVAAVRWSVDDWSRSTPPPFRLSFDAGPVPYERRIRAVALDGSRKPLYSAEATLNPGGRRVSLEFLSPVDGESVAGSAAVLLRVATPADDEVAGVSVEADGEEVALSSRGPGLYGGVARIPSGSVALAARLVTRRGRELERTVLVNAPGMTAAADVHVVEMLVGVSSGGRPVEGLGPADFVVREPGRTCEVRDAVLLRDAPLAIGFALDVSTSLRHAPELRRATADVFVQSCFSERDSAFVVTFGPVVTTALDWTRSKAALLATILRIDDYDSGGTALFEAVQKAIYRFQGSGGARALILVSDGFDVDGEVSEQAVFDYARISGVRIFTIGLTSNVQLVSSGSAPPGKVRHAVRPPNRKLLERLAAATGGRCHLVTDAGRLPGIYRAIERDLRTQYLVSFVSPARRAGKFHPVEVTSRGGRVRAAAGYFY